MAEVKWIKITTDVFDDEKIILIESLPDAYAIITVWFKLLCLAGKQNNSGVFLLGRLAYTDKMLATIFRMKESTVTMALNTFEEFGMVKIIDGVITIPNWEKHQSLDKMEQAREATRQRVAKHREKQKALIGQSQCQYCGETATGYDHIVATARGGADTEENKVPCCAECNRIKNDKPLIDFLNFNRERINDELVAQSPKLRRYVTLCNVTGRYIVTPCNADRIDKDKEEDKDVDKESKNIREKRPIRHKYGEYDNVLLSDADLEKLKNEFPHDWQERIENLSSYIASTGKSYKNHLATIRNWARKESERRTAQPAVRSTGGNPFLDLAKDENLF